VNQPIDIDVQEGQSGEIEFTMLDQADAAVQKATLVTLTLHLYDKRSGAIINGRENQNALDMNGVTMHATSGLVIWAMVPEDNPFLGSSRLATEVHVGRLRWTWDGGEKAFAQEFLITVSNLKQFTV